MATAKKFSALTPVSSPVGTAEVAVNEGGTTKRMTIAQVIGLAVAAALGTVSQSDAEAGTSTTRKVWTAQRVNQAIAALAGSASWQFITLDDTMSDGDLISITAATAKTLTVASTIAAGHTFTVHNDTTSAGVVSIEPNTGHTIRGPFGTAVGGTDTITLAPGETIRLLCKTDALIEIV